MKQSRRNKARVAIRRAEAAERQAFALQQTPQQRLLTLDERLGAGIGAVRERARLLKQIQDGKKPVAKETAEAIVGVPETKKELVEKKGRKSRGDKTRQDQRRP